MLNRFVCIFIGYFIGCIQSAYIVGKYMNTDLRTKGSGNLGTTNALRVLGKKAGFITFVCDIMKSVISFFICILLFKNNIGVIAGVYGSVGAILGHDFPFYLNFKGGKGVAAMIGMMLSMIYISPIPTIISFSIGLIALTTRYVSVGSIVFSIAIPFGVYIAKLDYEILVIVLIIGLLAIYRHKSNILRLINGNENRLGKKAN